MSYGKVLWNKVISKLDNPYILHCNCGTGAETVRVYAENGADKSRILAADRFQKNLDPLKADGFVTIKSNLEQSSLIRRISDKRFDVIVFTSEEKVWSPGLVSSATELPKLLNKAGLFVMVVPLIEEGKGLTGVALDIYNGLAKQFDKVKTKREEDVKKTFFFFGAKK